MLLSSSNVSGDSGVFTKESGIEEMAMAIRKVANGERYLSTEIAQKIAINSLHVTESSPFDRLSEREMQVMFMITNGLSVLDIASRLFLSAKTVNGYRYRMFDKLQIKNDVELTYLALKHRIIEQPADTESSIA